MTKSRFALRLGGALAIALAVLLIFSACAENSRTPDDTSSATEYTDTGSGSSATDGEAVIDDYTVEVSISRSSQSAGSSDTLAPKSLTATSGSYSTATSGELYWTYTAVKADSYFATGQTDSETWLSSSTDDDGNVTVSASLPESLPGKFSVGEWIFTFNAYTSADMSDDYLFYQGTETSVTLSSGGENTVSVTVELYEAVKDADEEGNTYGTLVVYGITFTNLDGETQTLSDITLWYSIDDGTLTEDADEAMLASSSESGLTFAELETGYHTFYACVTDTSGNVLASGSASAVVKPNLTTTITGDIQEDESATTAVTLGSLSVSYGSISVSSEAGLTAALADSEVSTVALASDLTLDEALTISNDTTIDLGSVTLTSDITVADGTSLTLTSSSDETCSLSGTIELGSGSSLTVDGVTLASEETGSILISATDADATITITDATLNSSENGRLIDVLLTEDSDKDGTLSITISDTTAYIDAVSGGSSYGASRGININGSSDESDGNLAKLELVLSSVTIIDETESSSYSVYPLNICYVDEANITIEDTTIKCNTNHYATRFYGIGNADSASTITITGSTLQGYSAITAIYMTNVEMNISKSSLLGYNYNDGNSSGYSTISLSYPIETVINVDECTVAFMEYGTATQALAGIEWSKTSSYANNSINFTNCTLEWNNKPEEESDERAFYNLENWYSDCTLSDDESYVVSGILCSNNSVNLDEATEKSLGIYGDDSDYVTYMDYLWLIDGDADLACTGQNNLLQLRTE